MGVIKTALPSKITLPTHIRYIRDKAQEPIEQDEHYKLYTSLGFRPEPEFERAKDGIVWIIYHPPQKSQSLDFVVENEAKNKALEYVNRDLSDALRCLGVEARRGLLKSLNYVFVKIPKIAIYYISNTTKNILSHVKH